MGKPEDFLPSPALPQPQPPSSLTMPPSRVGQLAKRKSRLSGGSDQSRRRRWLIEAILIAGLVVAAALPSWRSYDCQETVGNSLCQTPLSSFQSSLVQSMAKPRNPYGKFPREGDPFRFLPCTSATLPPRLNDSDPVGSWVKNHSPDYKHWSWGHATANSTAATANGAPSSSDPYAGRGLYLCGYMDVPLDFTNASDSRIARLAVTKYQVGGPLVRSERTIVIEPGGPGGSGTAYTWRAAENTTLRLSNGRFDVLGWDPRGVNMSQPAAACYPYDADRDRWALLTSQARAVSASPRAQLEVADAMNEATFAACARRLGDLGRFVSTAFVARDMDRIREGLGEPELTGYLVSYGTGIGQTYANMFPNRVGRLILDGTEYVRDHRLLGGFGFTALDNVTDAWRDGFLGECVNAGAAHCALANPRASDNGGALADLQRRMTSLFDGLTARPVPAYTEASGPVLVTYTSLVGAVYSALYNARTWPALARALAELEAGNATLAAIMVDQWEYTPRPTSEPCGLRPPQRLGTDELTRLVICADAYDAPQPAGGLDWWDSLWANMTRQSWIAGDGRFASVLPCRHFTRYWPRPAEVYRGDLNHTLRHPVLLVAETYDPATPLRNGRRLAREMGVRNARLVAHHGYGHSSVDKSACTDAIARAYILHGALPEAAETACYADEKPYLYDVGGGGGGSLAQEDPLRAWREHQAEMAVAQRLFH